MIFDSIFLNFALSLRKSLDDIQAYIRIEPENTPYAAIIVAFQVTVHTS